MSRAPHVVGGSQHDCGWDLVLSGPTVGAECSRRLTQLSVDSNGSLLPACLHLRIEVPWVEEHFPANTKGALAVVCTPTLKSVRAKEIVMCVKQFQS